MPASSKVCCLFLTATLAACGTGISLAKPSGQRMHLYVVDADTLMWQDQRMGWDEFRDRITARVKRAEAGKNEHPRVIVHTGKHRIDGFGDRMLSLLQAAGVRSVDFTDD